MALTLSRVDRLYRRYAVTATLAGGGAATITAVDVAFLPPRATPTSTTTWTPTTYTTGVATILIAGPDAAGNGALVIPADGADVWLRVVDSPEIDAERVERITIR